jgi:hypothetical protein
MREEREAETIRRERHEDQVDLQQRIDYAKSQAALGRIPFFRQIEPIRGNFFHQGRISSGPSFGTYPTMMGQQVIYLPGPGESAVVPYLKDIVGAGVDVTVLHPMSGEQVAQMKKRRVRSRSCTASLPSDASQLPQIPNLTTIPAHLQTAFPPLVSILSSFPAQSNPGPKSIAFLFVVSIYRAPQKRVQKFSQNTKVSSTYQDTLLIFDPPFVLSNSRPLVLLCPHSFTLYCAACNCHYNKLLLTSYTSTAELGRH